MPTPLDRDKIRKYLEDFNLRALFVEELGWDHGGENIEVTVASKPFVLEAIAHKRGMVVYQHVADTDEAFPDHPTRQKIEKTVAKTVREHLIVYAPPDQSAQYWQWVKREPGQPDRSRQHIYHRDQPGEALIQKLEQLVFTLDEEDDLTIVDVSGRVRAAFDVEKITKKFYDRFKQEHHAFLEFIEGIQNIADREWYASLMLNRMMFIYFIQKRGFLDNNMDYLRDRLERVRQQGGGNFLSFYRLFLLRLFHEGLGQPEADRVPELVELLGQVPYLNGGLFDVHDLERDNPKIHIPDEAFQNIFAFFDTYQWHLDDRPLHNDREINPDVLGYIFEKYINQKQMGAYYTKEDITGYISRNTILPFLFDRAKRACPIAFTPDGGVWRLLSENPDRYFYEAVRHGITYDIHKKEDLSEKRELPPDIAEGLSEVSKRGGWNKAAPADYALPTETWREHVARRQRYEEVRAKLAAGEVTSINDLITYNLDIEKFALDVIVESEGPELIRAFWKALNAVSVLDPTCGSGAFLFAALNILEPLYTTCLEVMRGFLDDLERSQRKHRPEKLRDLRTVLEQVAAHASESYFIHKSIIVNNLYGVDIMEEAVEICKLRLFLKLVAQLERYDQIEPLPDVDFNIRAGNTLVGFTSLDEVKKVLSADLIKQLSLPQIEERAEIADRAFRKFREMQTEHGMDASEFSATKVELRKRLDDLRDELDQYLAGDYGVKVKSKRAYQKWRDSHQPFHWFVEFYGIMHGGGFDVIIGNPPYAEMSKISEYDVPNYQTTKCANLYPFCVERSSRLLGHSRSLGMIVPLSGFSTKRMADYMDHVRSSYDLLWASYYSGDAHPSVMFSGVKYRLCIIIGQQNGAGEKSLKATDYLRWYANERPALFQRMVYSDCPFKEGFLRFSKVGSSISVRILRKILEKSTGNRILGKYIKKSGARVINYHRSPVFWIRSMNFEPYFKSLKKNRSTDHLRDLSFSSPEIAKRVGAIINSTCFYFWFTVQGNCRNIAEQDIIAFPSGEIEAASLDRLEPTFDTLMEDLQRNSVRRVYNYERSGRVEYDEFYPSKSKSVLNEIDRTLAQHYGFTDEELDFIINYDIKYRMGREATEGEV